jgi:hypothetical protein
MDEEARSNGMDIVVPNKITGANAGGPVRCQFGPAGRSRLPGLGQHRLHTAFSYTCQPFRYGLISGLVAPERLTQLTRARGILTRGYESLVRVPQTQPAFHPRGQRNAFSPLDEDLLN